MLKYSDNRLLTNKFSLYILSIFALVTLYIFPSFPVHASDKIITIGTAGVTGVYYPAGGAICRLMNRSRKETGIRCTVESTGGSINNLEAVRKGDIELGIVQSDLLYYAYNGAEIFSDVGADKKLRVLFALHSEPLTIVARKDANIVKFEDLQGKRVNIGAPGSGIRATMEELMMEKGWNEKTFSALVDIKSGDLSGALCGNKLDAVAYAGGHPNGTIQQLTASCETKLISLNDKYINKLVEKNPFYFPAVIPGGTYKGNPKDIRTVGVKAVLVASEDLDDDVVYEMVKSVFERIEDFKTLHPVFSTLQEKNMVHDSKVAPLHNGAARYFREKGLIE